MTGKSLVTKNLESKTGNRIATKILDDRIIVEGYPDDEDDSEAEFEKKIATSYFHCFKSDCRQSNPTTIHLGHSLKNAIALTFVNFHKITYCFCNSNKFKLCSNEYNQFQQRRSI